MTKHFDSSKVRAVHGNYLTNCKVTFLNIAHHTEITSMDSEAIYDLVDDLAGDIDTLEESLQPLITEALSASTSKLPLLDKAKLYVLATYAIESILFSYLRLNGVKAKDHPVFQELARVKEYFAKIKAAEGIGFRGADGPSARLNKAAAARVIKHDLAGNDRYDREHAEHLEKELTSAKRKLEEMSTGKYTRLDGAAKKAKGPHGEEQVKVVKASDLASSSSEESEAENGKASVIMKQAGSKSRSSSKGRGFASNEDQATKALFKKAYKKSGSDRAQLDAYIAQHGGSLTPAQNQYIDRLWNRKMKKAAKG